MWEVTTQVSAPKSSTACITAFKKIRIPEASLPPCWGCATSYSKPSLTGPSLSPTPASIVLFDWWIPYLTILVPTNCSAIIESSQSLVVAFNPCCLTLLLSYTSVSSKSLTTNISIAEDTPALPVGVSVSIPEFFDSSKSNSSLLGPNISIRSRIDILLIFQVNARHLSSYFWGRIFY